MLNSIHFGESALSQVALDLIRISKILPVLKQSQDGYPRNTSLTVKLRCSQCSHLGPCPQRQWVFGHADKKAPRLGTHSSGKGPWKENGSGIRFCPLLCTVRSEKVVYSVKLMTLLNENDRVGQPNP